MRFLFRSSLVIAGLGNAFGTAIPNSENQCNAAAAGSFTQAIGLNTSAAQNVQSLTMQYAHELGFCGGNGTASMTTRVGLACLVSQYLFASQGDDKFLSPNSIEYEERVDVNWSSACWLNASCIVEPENAQDVAKIVQIVNFFGAKFSTRSGGHNPNPGFASTGSEGLLIDLIRLNTLEFTANNASLRVGPGNRFLQVYSLLNGTGKFVLGGRVPDVGVGGFFLGGGMPTWSSLFGTASDNILRYETVLANSTIVNATASENSDLFWALKGGESNFGIVTEFEPRTVDLSSVYYEAVLYNASYTPQLLDAMIRYQAAAENDSNAGLIYNWAPGEVLLGFAYAKPIFRPSIFNDFYALPNMATYINGSISTPTDMSIAYSNVSPLTPGRRLTFSIAHKTSLDVYNAAYNKFLELAPAAASTYNGSLSVGIQPFTSEAVRQGLGKNALGLQPVSQNWMTGVIQWFDPNADQQAFDTINSMANTTKQASIQAGADLDFIFMNDANYGQDVLKGYGDANLARLRQVSQAYDPTQFFQRQQVNGFLLYKA